MYSMDPLCIMDVIHDHFGRDKPENIVMKYNVAVEYDTSGQRNGGSLTQGIQVEASCPEHAKQNALRIANMFGLNNPTIVGVMLPAATTEHVVLRGDGSEPGLRKSSPNWRTPNDAHERNQVR